MRYVDIKATPVPQGPSIEDMLKKIELCGRVCYHTENKITEDSFKKFVAHQVKDQHYSPLEHGHVYLTIPHNGDYNELIEFFTTNTYSYCVLRPEAAYVTTNFRVIVENKLETFMKEFWSTPSDWHMPRITVKIDNFNIAGYKDGTRHRSLSPMIESTRYVSSCQKRFLNSYDCNSLQGIEDAYNDGFSCKEIATKSNWAESTISAKLRDRGVVKRGLNNKGIRNVDFFEKIDTPLKAYFLGIIQTDGSVRSKGTYELSITQHAEYSDWIEALVRHCIGEPSVSDDKACKQISIGSKKLVQDLINLGIVPNKSNVQTDADVTKLWSAIPDEFKADFVRGFIDGDGSVLNYKSDRQHVYSIHWAGKSRRMIELITDWVNSVCGSNYKVSQSAGVFRSFVSGKVNFTKLAEVLLQHFEYPWGHPKKTNALCDHIPFHMEDVGDPLYKCVNPVILIPKACTRDYIEWVLDGLKLEKIYVKWRMRGYPPEVASEFLPQQVAATTYWSGFLPDWEHFLYLRFYEATGKVRPEVKEASSQVFEVLNNEFPDYEW